MHFGPMRGASRDYQIAEEQKPVTEATMSRIAWLQDKLAGLSLASRSRKKYEDELWSLFGNGS